MGIEELLNRCDLFIYQDIRKDNEFGYKLSAEYLLCKLSENMYSKFIWVW